MKLPHELIPGDRFYYRHSIGEDVKLWKVVATGLNSLIATSEHIRQVPLFYDQMAEPDRHFCYVPPKPSFMDGILRAFSTSPPTPKLRELA